MFKPPMLILLLCAFALAGPAAAQKLYKYTDTNGKVVYTDKMPSEAAGKANEQLNRQGTVTKRNEGALTPEQLAAKEAARKKKLDEELAAKEEKRKNMALLNTYSSEQDIADARTRAIASNGEAIQDAERKLAEALKRQLQLADEAEFYKKKPMPALLKQEIQVNESAIASHTESARQEEEGDEAISAKYDEDLRRYREVIKSSATAAAGAAPVAAATTRPATKTDLAPARSSRPWRGSGDALRERRDPAVSWKRRESAQTGRRWPSSLLLRISLTCAGFALPFVAFITWPTSELKAFSLPAR